MDRERMIEVLKRDRDLAMFNPMTGECVPMNEDNAESAEALSMAIAALEAYVPDTNVGDMISRQAATTIPVMPKEHRHYQTNNLDDAYEQGWNDLQECIENLPTIQPKRGKWKSGKCDQCGGSAPFWPLANTYYRSNFCPHCGADMRGGVDG